MQNSTEQCAEWDSIWARKSLLSKTIDAGREVYNFFYKKLLGRHIRHSTALLEVGCGTSTLTLSLAHKMKKLVGIDISETALLKSRGLAKELNVANAEFVYADCTKLPADLKNAFDLVWSQGLLEHFENPVDIVRAHCDALAPGGSAFLSVPYRYSYHTIWYKLTRPKILRRFWPWTEQVFYRRRELKKIAQEVTSNYRIFFLKPFILGIVILEIKK